MNVWGYVVLCLVFSTLCMVSAFIGARLGIEWFIENIEVTSEEETRDINSCEER